jgi:hypothetical protein
LTWKVAARLRRVLLRRPVLGELVGAQHQAERHLGHPRLPAGEHGQRHRAVEDRDRRAGEPRLLRRRLPRQLDDEHRLGGEPGGMGEHMAAARLGLDEGPARDQPPDRAAGQPVDTPRQRVEPAVARGEDRDPPRDFGDFRGVCGDEGGLQWRGHDALP